MKKLNLAIIGQGRSGKDIHGKYYISESNQYYNVKYVVEADARRRQIAEKMYPGARAFESYESLFDIDDIDIVVNASYSDEHYSITKAFLQNGKNVLVEKPFAPTKADCEELMAIAKQNGVTVILSRDGKEIKTVSNRNEVRKLQWHDGKLYIITGINSNTT